MKLLLTAIVAPLFSFAANGLVAAEQDANSKNDAAYMQRMQEFRQNYEKDLKTEEGWLSVAGLFWLSEGENSLGSAASCKVRLPAGAAPPEVGSLNLNEGKVSLNVQSGATVLINGKPATTEDLKTDSDTVKIGSVHFKIIQRGKRIGVRLFDSKGAGLTGFKGLHWYPIRPAYVVKAKFVPYNPPKMIAILNVLGDTRMSPSPGYLEFTLDGKPCRLDAEPAGSGLFLNFQDLTTGKSTYPAGRFLNTPGPKDGFVDIDFNQATNPPCAFTEYATCPLPPDGNRLPVAIKAGEMTYHVGH